jgi:excisionase family DNA binding protein
MESLTDIKKPTKEEQRVAMESFDALSETLKELRSENPEIEIENSPAKIKIPINALKLLAKILKVTSQGDPITVVPFAAEMTTQSAAEFIGCSRPHIVKLLEEGKIPYTKVGRHRRIKFEHLVDYKNKMKAERKERLINMMKKDEESGLYDA